MTGEIKILFTSDIHLGAPEHRTGIPGFVRMTTFKRILSLAKDHDILLIGGDLFDSSSVEGDLLMDVKEEFLRLEETGTKVLLVPGLGELGTQGDVSETIRSLPVQRVFLGVEGDSPWTMSREDLDLSIYGLPVHMSRDVSLIPSRETAGFRMGLFYLTLDDPDVLPPVFSMRTKDLRSLPFDFCGLGHCHHFRLFKANERILAAYPGSPEAVEPDETGDRYVISMTVRDNRIQVIRRLTVNSLRLQEEIIDVTGMERGDAIIGLLEKHRSQRVIITARLQGRRTFDIPGDYSRIWGEGFHSMRIIDESVPALGYLVKTYSREDSLRGDFFRAVRTMIETGSISETEGNDELARLLAIMAEKGGAGVEDYLCDL